MSALACTVGPNSVSPGQILLVYGIVVQNENIQAAGRRKDLLRGGPKKVGLVVIVQTIQKCDGDL